MTDERRTGTASGGDPYDWADDPSLSLEEVEAKLATLERVQIVRECSPPLDAAAQAQQRQDLDDVVWTGGIAAALAINRDKQVSTAVQMSPTDVAVQIGVRSALAYLLGHGWISVLPRDQRPELNSQDIPEHLRPDIAAIVGARSMELAASVLGIVQRATTESEGPRAAPGGHSAD